MLVFETAWPWPSSLKVGLLRFFGGKVGRGVVVKPSVKIKYPWFLKVGDHCWIGEQVWIDNLAQVTLGNHVVVSQGAYLLTGNHDYKSPHFDLSLGPIVIGDGAWIAARSIVGPGVTVGTLTVLGLGAVATRDLEERSVYGGNPAQRLRERILNQDPA